MALSMDEERMLAEIERRLADDDPVLAARLTSFRLPRLSLGPRSSRGRLTASLLMLVVVAAVSVFVYALMPFRGQNGGNLAAHSSASPSMSATSQSMSPMHRTAPNPQTSQAGLADRGPTGPNSPSANIKGDIGS
jgi:Protein of unknown function (DUF3040)